MTGELLWPVYATPADLPAIEAIPLADRGLPATTYDVLARAADLWPDRTAISALPEAARRHEYSSLTFGQLYAAVNQVANLLVELGVSRQDAVGLLAPNCQELVVATLAAQTAGLAAPVNSGLSYAHVAGLWQRSGARVIIVAGPEFDGPGWETGLKLAADGAVDTVLVLRPIGAESVAPELPAVDGVRIGYLEALSATRPANRFVGTPPVAGDLAAVFHTGGTTGVPKLAAHTHANEVIDAWMIALNTLLDEDSVVFAALPLFHVNALVVTLLAPLLRGQHVVWAGPQGYRDLALYGELWKIIEHFRVSAMSAVPTVYQVLAQCPVDADISSLRLAMVGASPLPTAVCDAFEGRTGVRLTEGYGLTEATCASVRSFSEQPRPGSVGQRLPYQHLKVVRVEDDGSWTDLVGGAVGLLVIHGPTVFPGYVTGRDARGLVIDGMGKLNQGWLDTGDLARIADDGFVYLTGRAKDLIIRGGHNIDPAAIEDALLSHPDVAAAGAVGRPDKHSGEVPVAYAVLVPGASVTEKELQAWAADHVGEKAAAPKSVHLLNALPLTDVGKPYKPALRADAARRAVQDELARLGVRGGVGAEVIDGSVQVCVILSDDKGDSDAQVVRMALECYPMQWRFAARPEPTAR
jgi:fatty-acyl-CoA synthase